MGDVTAITGQERKTRSYSQYLNRLIAREVSRISRYFDSCIQWRPRSGDSKILFYSIDCKEKLEIDKEFPDLRHEVNHRTLVLLNGNVNHHYDIQLLFQEIFEKISRTSRLVCIAYNPYLAWLYRLANFLGLRAGELPSTFVTRTDICNLARLSGFEVVRIRPVGYIPWSLFGLGTFLNSILASLPLLRWLSFVTVITLRPWKKEKNRPSLSIVIPARNEKGNIENALKRMPNLQTDIEILFVEGHSTDGTWEEIQRVSELYASKFKSIRMFKQKGKGKADAVRLGFEQASGDLMTILDADLTMPPELLGRFYEAYLQGHADFINGTRLVYPMEGEAMRFLNRLGNIFFAKSLSAVLETKLGDSLCGTKLLARHDYYRIQQWVKDFGDFDPFGDFELLFPAAVLGLGIVDIPIRYLARTYGTTNIHRFRHGFMLLRMSAIGLFRIRMGAL